MGVDSNVNEINNTLNDKLADELVSDEIKLYKRRWVILAIYIMYNVCSAMQWIQYSIITNIIVKYYDVSPLAVNWTSMICMCLYPSLMVPGLYVIDKMGLRTVALLGVIGTTVGSWIKVFSVQPHLFWVGFLGQTVVFTFQIFIFSLPPKIAAEWFPSDEVSTACSLGVLGTLLGTAIGFIVPPMVVKNHDNLDDIGAELSSLFYGVAITLLPLVVLVCIFFQREPPHPPSVSQQRKNKTEFSSKKFWSSYKAILTNKSFILLMMSYSLNICVFAGISTMLNQFVLFYFPDGEEDAGRIGLLIVAVGMAGSVIFGIVLDKTRKFKETAVCLYSMTLIGAASFMYSLRMSSKTLAYISSSFMGFFLGGYYPAGYELGVELTYPHSESTSCGFLNSLAQIFGVLFTLLLGWLFDNVGVFWALSSTILILTLGLGITLVIPNNLRRQAAIKGQYSDVEFKPVQ